MRGKPIQVGDNVLFRFFNRPSKHFYGNVRRGKITHIGEKDGVKMYWLDTPAEYEPYNVYETWVLRKEIKRVV
jgi:hypothetical protein